MVKISLISEKILGYFADFRSNIKFLVNLATCMQSSDWWMFKIVKSVWRECSEKIIKRIPSSLVCWSYILLSHIPGILLLQGRSVLRSWYTKAWSIATPSRKSNIIHYHSTTFRPIFSKIFNKAWFMTYLNIKFCWKLLIES